MQRRAEIERTPVLPGSAGPWRAAFALREVYPLGLFYALYAIGAYLSVWLEQAHIVAAQSDLAVYLTSPFGSIENLQLGVSLWGYGIVENFLLVTAIMVLVAGYHVFLSSRNPSSPSLASLFFAATAATYFVSLADWIVTGTPASGTSVIAFSLLAYLLLACAMETWGEVEANSRLGKSVVGLDALAWTGQTAVILLLSLYYLVGNASAAFHLGGAILTGAILLAATHAGPD
jgi:hypothetical protein